MKGVGGLPIKTTYSVDRTPSPWVHPLSYHNNLTFSRGDAGWQPMQLSPVEKNRMVQSVFSEPQSEAELVEQLHQRTPMAHSANFNAAEEFKSGLSKAKDNPEEQVRAFSIGKRTLSTSRKSQKFTVVQPSPLDLRRKGFITLLNMFFVQEKRSKVTFMNHLDWHFRRLESISQGSERLRLWLKGHYFNRMLVTQQYRWNSCKVFVINLANFWGKTEFGRKDQAMLRLKAMLQRSQMREKLGKAMAQRLNATFQRLKRKYKGQAFFQLKGKWRHFRKGQQFSSMLARVLRRHLRLNIKTGLQHLKAMSIYRLKNYQNNMEQFLNRMQLFRKKRKSHGLNKIYSFYQYRQQHFQRLLKFLTWLLPWLKERRAHRLELGLSKIASWSKICAKRKALSILAKTDVFRVVRQRLFEYGLWMVSSCIRKQLGRALKSYFITRNKNTLTADKNSNYILVKESLQASEEKGFGFYIADVFQANQQEVNHRPCVPLKRPESPEAQPQVITKVVYVEKQRPVVPPPVYVEKVKPPMIVPPPVYVEKVKPPPPPPVFIQKQNFCNICGKDHSALVSEGSSAVVTNYQNFQYKTTAEDSFRTTSFVQSTPMLPKLGIRPLSNFVQTTFEQYPSSFQSREALFSSFAAPVPSHHYNTHYHQQVISPRPGYQTVTVHPLPSQSRLQTEGSIIHSRERIQSGGSITQRMQTEGHSITHSRERMQTEGHSITHSRERMQTEGHSITHSRERMQNGGNITHSRERLQSFKVNGDVSFVARPIEIQASQWRSVKRPTLIQQLSTNPESGVTKKPAFQIAGEGQNNNLSSRRLLEFSEAEQAQPGAKRSRLFQVSPFESQ